MDWETIQQRIQGRTPYQAFSDGIAAMREPRELSLGAESCSSTSPDSLPKEMTPEAA